MDYIAYFTPWATQTNNFLAQHFQQRIKASSKTTPIAKDVWEKIQKFITGGKRMRGGLVKLGYETAGGKNSKSTLPISAAIEIFHGSILIHDDIADQDDIRHNNPTVHKVYEAYHKANYKKGSSLHYGESMAMIIGDAGLYDTIWLISNSTFPENLKTRAISHICKYVIDTVYGELLDIDLAYKTSREKSDILDIYTLKTAWYTICGPLQVGAILAGVTSQKNRSFEEYAIPLGIAFQIQDDILGIFGSTEKTGKSTASDIKEGKNTLLYTEAIKRSTSKQRARLEKSWGNREITSKEAQETRDIIQQTGSLAHCQKLATKLAKEAKDAVPSITKDKNLQEVYTTLADFIIDRES